MKFYPVAAMWILSTLALAARGSEWPNWRGPFFNGSSDEVGLPSHWSTTENVVWSVELPGAAASTPIIWGDRVFVSGTDEERDVLLASCFDRGTGRALWRHDVAAGIRRDDRSNFASPSPVTDGRLVVFFFGNGRLVCYSVAGERMWERDLQREHGAFAFLWTFSSSPLLFGDTLYVQVLQRDVPVEGRGVTGRENESYLLALQPSTGKTLWRHVRPSSAVDESREAFTTPIPWVESGRDQLLLAGGDALTGHDPQTGQELWRWDNWNPRRIGHWRLVPSPVAGAGIALLCAPKGEPIFALKTGGSGLLDDRALAWRTGGDNREVSADVPTPAFHAGDFFVLNDMRRVLFRVEGATGKIKWTARLSGRGESSKCEASPLVADGKVYVVNFAGQVTVLRADDGRVVESISMDQPAEGEKVRASIAAAHGQLFIRTTRRLYCVAASGR